MRRLLSGVAAYLAGLSRAARGGWNSFFFLPADPTPLGLIRIGTGLLAFWSLLVFGLDLHDYFGSAGWADPEMLWQSQRLRQPFAWSFWFFVPDALLRPVWIGCLLVLASFTLGLFSRTTAALAWIIVVSTVRRVPMALFGFDQIVSTLLFYLAVSLASGQAVSLDRFLGRWRQARDAARQPRPHGSAAPRRVSPPAPGVPRGTISANLALRLIQVHIVFIYLMAGLAKLQGPSWWNGMALWGTMTAGEFVTQNYTALAAWPRLINALTHASLALELAYPVLIWVPVLRPLLIVAIAALHLGIGLVAPGLTEFGLAMLAGNLAFVSGPWLRGLVTGIEQPGIRVLFDGDCPRCRASMALLTASDPDRVVEPIDLTAVEVGSVHPSLTKKACMDAMHAISRSGRVSIGFDAVRALGGWLPLFWLPTLFAWIPGVAPVGRVAYNRIAASRPRDVPCTDDVCGLHPPSSSSNGTERNRPPARNAITSPSRAASREVKLP